MKPQIWVSYFSFFFFLFTHPVFGQSPLLADAGADLTVCQGSFANLEGTATDGTEPYSYSWTPSAMILDPTSPTSQTIALSVSTTFYLEVMDDLGGLATDSVFVYVDPSITCYKLNYYNTFTPNGDGVNDAWVIVNIEKYPQNSLQIYNRYGKLVYKAEPYTNSWTGLGLGDDLPSATYYYIFDPGDGSEIIKGPVTIIR